MCAGLKKRLTLWRSSKADGRPSGPSIKQERVAESKAKVQSVMETSGGDNAALAKKIHERYERCVASCRCKLLQLLLLPTYLSQCMRARATYASSFTPSSCAAGALVISIPFLATSPALQFASVTERWQPAAQHTFCTQRAWCLHLHAHA